MKVPRNFLLAGIGVACAFLGGCGGSSTPKTTNVIVPSGQNVAAITVDGGPLADYPDAAFAAVTVCAPGTSTCQSIDHLLVDTGSSGLRIPSTVLTIPLPQQVSTSGSPVVECLQFLASYSWGPVQTADVQISGEKASSVPIQVLSDTDFTVPSSCSSVGPAADTVAALGANGILGVGFLAQDCGPETCPATSNMYYECPASGCSTIAESITQQVQNPVALFATDNNGVIVELPAVSGAEASVTGSLVFGIGTQSNNAVGGATVYTAPEGSITTNFNSQSFPGSFLDSGSNGYFFQDSNIPQCTGGDAGFYCPVSTDNLSAINQASNGASGTINFSVANASTLFSNGNDFAFGDLGGPVSGGPPLNYFDWGLPFFFGRDVYTAIDGKSTPGGAGPYWAY